MLLKRKWLKKVNDLEEEILLLMCTDCESPTPSLSNLAENRRPRAVEDCAARGTMPDSRLHIPERAQARSPK